MVPPSPQDDSPKMVPPPLPGRASTASVPASQGPGGTRPVPPPPPVIETASVVEEGRSKAERLEMFLEKARFILAGERGVTAKSQVMLAKVARELGLSDEDAENAVRLLQHATTDDVSPPVSAPPVDPRWHPEEPPRVKKDSETPQEVFQAYVTEALANSSRDSVSERRERKLAGEGVRKLGLSEVLARQIVRQVAAASGKRVLSLEQEPVDTGELSGSFGPPNIDEFLERAAAILAEQRGINSKSRVLLAAAAGELGLSDDEMEQAIASLQSGRSDDDKQDAWQREREESFREYLGDAIAQLPHGVVTSRTEQKWIEDGDGRHGVETEIARRIVREVLAAHDIRVVSEDQAKEHVAALVRELVGESARLDGPTRARVFSEGSQWGLAPMQVDVIIREHINLRRRKLASERGLTGILLTSAVGALLALIGFLVWVFLLETDETRHTQELATLQTSPVAPPSPTQAIEAPTGKEWWAKDEDLLVAVTKTRIVLPTMKGVLVGLNLKDPEARGRSYRELVSVAGDNADDERHRAILGELIANCYVAEPSDQCAQDIREALLNLAPEVGDPLPQDDLAYDVAFWAVRTALTALALESLSAARADDLARAIGQKVGATIDGTLDAPNLQRQCLAALCHHLYRVIIASAASQPLVAGPIYSAVTRKAVHCLEANVLEKLHVDFLAIVLPEVGEAWREYEYLIQKAINSADPLVVLKLVELYEEVTDASLRDFLAGRLLRRAGVFPGSLSVDEVAQRVREALGAKHVVSGRHRWKQLAEHAGDLLDDRDVSAENTDQFLQQVVNLSHAATMTCSLAQGEMGYASYDELRQDGPMKLATSSVSRAKSPRRGKSNPTSASQRQSILRYIHYLTDPRRQPSHRPVYLRGIASFAAHVADLDPEPAELLARYLLKVKSDAEHQIILEHAETVTRWKYVRLALADQVLETPLYKERIQELMSRVLRKELQLADDEDWKQRFHKELLRDVIDDLSLADKPIGDKGQIYDDASDSLRDLYRTQARLLGVAPSAYDSAQTPSQLLRHIIETYAAKLKGGSSSSDARQFLADLPHHFDAIEYLSENDLHRTALLQRLWLRMLSLGMAHDHAEQANALVDKRESANSTSGVLAQLRDTEKAILQMWLLANPSES